MHANKHPDIDPCIIMIWVYSMAYLLNVQGIYDDENEGRRLYKQCQK